MSNNEIFLITGELEYAIDVVEHDDGTLDVVTNYDIFRKNLGI